MYKVTHHKAKVQTRKAAPGETLWGSITRETVERKSRLPKNKIIPLLKTSTSCSSDMLTLVGRSLLKKPAHLVWRQRDAARGLFGGWRPATDRERRARRSLHCPHTVARELIDTVVVPQALQGAVSHRRNRRRLGPRPDLAAWRYCRGGR